MTSQRRRALSLLLGLAVFIAGFGSAAVLHSSFPALAGSLGLLAGLLALDRIPPGRS